MAATPSAPRRTALLPCGVVVGSREVGEAAAATGAVATAGDRPPAPSRPRQRAPAPRHEGPGAAARPAHAAPLLRAPCGGYLLAGRRAGDHEDPRRRLRVATYQADAASRVPARRGHHLRALRRRVAPAPQDLHRRAAQPPPRPLLPPRPRGRARPPPPLHCGSRVVLLLAGEPDRADVRLRRGLHGARRHRQPEQPPRHVLASGRGRTQDHAGDEPAGSLPVVAPRHSPQPHSRQDRAPPPRHDGFHRYHHPRTPGEQSRAAATDAGVAKDEDLLDVLLRLQKDMDSQYPLTTMNIKSILIDMFGAGSETSATTLQWAMAEMIYNPAAMRRAQDEVRRELAGYDRVTEDSITNLHYLRLVIKETLRLHPPAPLLLPRECGSACRVLDYDVLAGTMVLVNAWAIGRDPSRWDSPEEFSPERFESCERDFGGMDFEFIPFGAGRRICPGMAFGLAHIELALAALLFHFDWQLPDGMAADEMDMTEAAGITVRRRADLLVFAVAHVPVPVQ